MMALPSIAFLIFLLVLLTDCDDSHRDCYTSSKLPRIPHDHLYFRLKHPIVIGHKGNIAAHQENTLEGMMSLIRMKAGGIHMQVQLTRDNFVVLFGDDNLKRMTGYDFKVSRFTYRSIFRMPLLKTVEYTASDSKKIKKYYSTSLRIPLLQEVLEAVKGKNLLIYIELLPDHVPVIDPLERHFGHKTSRLVGEMIKSLEMEKEVIVVSKDAFKLKSLNYFAPDIVSGWWMDSSMFLPQIALGMKRQYSIIPDIYYYQCFDKSPDGSPFSNYLLTSGIVSKAVNASLLDISMAIYHDDNYANHFIKDAVKKNYGDWTSLGAFNIYDVSENSKKSSLDDDKTYIQTALDNGVTRFITDDVNRVKLALNEVFQVAILSSIISLF